MIEKVLFALYELIGVPWPRASLLGAFLVGGLCVAFFWNVLAKSYKEDHSVANNKIPVEFSSKPDIPITAPQPAEKETPQTQPQEPISKQPPTIVQPPIGNLKQRTIDLSEEITGGLDLFGWRSKDIPNTAKDFDRQAKSISNYFCANFLERVIDIKKELDRKDYKNHDLDEDINMILELKKIPTNKIVFWN